MFNTFSLTSVSDIEKHFLDELKNKFGDVFQDGLGCCTKSKTILKSKEDSKPIFRPKRLVLYAAFDMVEKELRLQKGVIEPTNYCQ